MQLNNFGCFFIQDLCVHSALLCPQMLGVRSFDLPSDLLNWELHVLVPILVFVERIPLGINPTLIHQHPQTSSCVSDMQKN